MNHSPNSTNKRGLDKKVIPIALQGQAQLRQRKREAPKGRRIDPKALDEVQLLLGNSSRQSDLLIEHLHKIQDRYGHLSAAHLAALAQEMQMAQVSVYEVASFYHHFDIVKEGGQVPAPLTVRVCDGLSCEMAGAKDLLNKLPSILGLQVRVIAVPCIGRCEQAPAALVGQHPVSNANCDSITNKVQAGQFTHLPEAYTGRIAYESAGGYQLLKQCMAGDKEVDSVIQIMEDASLRGLGGAGFPTGRKWRIVRAETPVCDAAGLVVGRVVSGTLSPIINEAIGTALVAATVAAAPLLVDIRGTKINLQLVKPPFVSLKKS